MTIAHGDGRDRGAESDSADRSDPRTAIEPQAAALVNSPLDFLLAEHLRQRQAAKILLLIADGLINRRTIAAVIRFIEDDLAQHILDEEACFFPILRGRCEKDDNIDALLNVLADEHREDEQQSGEALRILRVLAVGGDADAGSARCCGSSQIGCDGTSRSRTACSCRLRGCDWILSHWMSSRNQ
ncbi:MAG: hemerythrin domain-containing protein [Parvularculaceae bacterium]|nr:hemerythrin domain-containing protein [Parvularculaceae bacterium]